MVKSKIMDCGVKLLWENISGMKSVSLGIWVKTGSVDENEDNNGIAHYIEHMRFKATSNRTAKDIARDMDKASGIWNAFTGKEYTCFYFKVISEELANSTDLLTDMFVNSKFDEEELQKERDVILEEIKMIEDNPDELAHELLVDHIFKGGDYAKSIIGTEESLSKIGRNEILEFIKENYTKDNVFVVAVGDLETTDNLESLLNPRLNLLEAEKKNKDGVKASKKEDYTAKFQCKVKDIEQAHICIGNRNLPIYNEDYFAMLAINHIFGSSYASRLFQSVREDKGLAYSVFSNTDMYFGEGAFYIYAGVHKDKIELAVKAIRDELLRLKEEGLTEEDLNSAKTQLKTSLIFSDESTHSRMLTIGKQMLSLDRVLSPEEMTERMNNVTMEQINKLINMITDIDSYSGVLINSKEEDLEAFLKN